MSDKISNSTTSDGKPLPEKAARSRVAMATLAGTTLEWYDFFLYGTAAALIFNKQFFPSLSPTAGTLAAFSTFAVGFIARPVGGLVFGHFGDRIGRKATLVVSLVMMGVGSTLIGLIPNYDSIGFWAPSSWWRCASFRASVWAVKAPVRHSCRWSTRRQGRRICTQVSRRWAHPPDWFSPTASS